MKINYVFVSVLLLGLLLAACKSKKETIKLDNEAVVFKLSKGACFGQCPVFKMEIKNDGLATFSGLRYCKKQGIYQKQLSEDAMSQLIKAFKEADFYGLKDSYESQIADLPLIIVAFNDGSGIKTIQGKESRPEALMQLQFMLEKVADKDDWKFIRGLKKGDLEHTKKSEVAIIDSEVIIEPNPGVSMPKWLASKSTMGVRLIKKIAPNLNYFLITYDQDVITPENFMMLMKDDKEIKNAEFNKKTETRNRGGGEK